MKEQLKSFFEEIDTVCKKYNLSISHEDMHGAFLIESYHEKYTEWLKEAYVARKPDKNKG